MKLTTSYLTTPCDGEIVSGDAVVVRREPDATMIAMIDVLGHGPEAAKIAGVAVRHLHEVKLGRATELLLGLHDALKGTRGAAASICVVRGAKIDGCGVGNVEVRVQGSPVPILLTPGIVGQRVHRLRHFEARLSAGDRLVVFSDGISSQVPLDQLRALSPGDACATVMRLHRRRHDDATVLITDLDP